MSPPTVDRRAIDDRFSEVFAHLGFVIAYVRRRGGRDPEATAAEVMTIAWRRLADVPGDDARPWLVATARNLMLADWPSQSREDPEVQGGEVPAAAEPPAPLLDLDPELEIALRSIPVQDREALLLVAWENLTSSLAAASLGNSPGAFRVRLHRARRRLIYELDHPGPRAAPEQTSPPAMARAASSLPTTRQTTPPGT